MTNRQQYNNQITLYYIKQIKTEIAKLMLGHEIKKILCWYLLLIEQLTLYMCF